MSQSPPKSSLDPRPTPSPPKLYLAIGAAVSALLLLSLLPLGLGLWQARTKLTANPSANTLDSQALGYELLLQREPDNSSALRGLLDLRLQQQNLPAAIAPLERLGQLHPDQPQYRLLLAEVKERLGDKGGAATVYRELLQANPYQIQALKKFSQLYQSQGRAPEAIALVQNAITQGIKAQTQGTLKGSDLTALQLLLGEIYLQQNRFEPAIAVYQAASQVNPTDFRPPLALAQLFQLKGQPAAAAPLFQQALRLAPVQYKESIKALARKQAPVAPSPVASPPKPN